MTDRGPEHFEPFYEQIGEANAFEVLLRGHLWVEVELVMSLESALPVPSLGELDRLRFPQKVALAASLGLIRADDVPAYKRLNAMRNRLAHDLHAAPTLDDTRELIGCMGPVLRRDMATTVKVAQQWPYPLRYAITAMCVRLQLDRARMEDANTRLRQSVQRVLDLKRPPPA